MEGSKIASKNRKEKTISFYEVTQMFPDGEAARQHIESICWPDGQPVCPTCSGKINITRRKRPGFYRCNRCKKDFTVRSNTIFGSSRIGLHKWIMAIYQVATARKEVSSLQLSKELGITQKSAWFMLQRIREAMGTDASVLKGIVAVDEAYIGGKEKNKHAGKKLRSGRGAVGKQAVLGMRERGGRDKPLPVADNSQETLQGTIASSVEKSSTVYTD